MAIHTFRAGPDGINAQAGIPNAAYTVVQARTDFNVFGVAGYDTGNEWNNSTFTWTPQAGPIDWNVQGWAGDFGPPGGNWNLVLTCFKNGTDFWAAIGGAQFNTFANYGSATNSGMDIANGTDTYQFKVYMTTINGIASGFLNNDPRHIWIGGRSYGAL